jgi:hypothetical protein
MELVLHYIYVVALKDTKAWRAFPLTPGELAVIGFWNLIIVWLKVMLPSSLFLPIRPIFLSHSPFSSLSLGPISRGVRSNNSRNEQTHMAELGLSLLFFCLPLSFSLPPPSVAPHPMAVLPSLGARRRD